MPLNRGMPTPGQLRNTLGSGLKDSGFFQKDGHIQNLRGGFLGTRGSGGMGGMPPVGGGLFAGQGPMPPQQGFAGQGIPNPMNNPMNSPMNNPMAQSPMPQGMGGPAPAFYPGKARQLILQATQPGFPGNGIATISPDNQFNIVANLPAPHTLSGQSGASYVAYLVDEKGKSGFPVGVLRPVSSGVYQTSFQSQVPLTHYNKAIISLESSPQLSGAPNGPILLKVKEGFGGGAAAFLTPVGNGAKSVWGKLTGLVKGRGKKVPGAVGPEAPAPAAGMPGGAVPSTGTGAVPGTGAIPGAGVIPGAGAGAALPGAVTGAGAVNQEVAPELVRSLQQMGVPIEPRQ